MLAMKPERQQGDGKQDRYSLESGLDCSNMEDLARQEFKDDVDLNKLLHRFGVLNLTAPRLQMHHGIAEVDYNLDLQTSIHAVEDVTDAYLSLPQVYRDTYPTLKAFLAALADGTFKMKTETPPAEPAAKPNTGDNNGN